MQKAKPILYFYLALFLITLTWYLLYSFGLSNLDFTEWKEEQRKYMLIYSGVSLLSYYVLKALKDFNS